MRSTGQNGVAVRKRVGASMGQHAGRCWGSLFGDCSGCINAQCSALSNCLLRPILEIDRSCGNLLWRNQNALDPTDIDTDIVCNRLQHCQENQFRPVRYVLSGRSTFARTVSGQSTHRRWQDSILANTAPSLALDAWFGRLLASGSDSLIFILQSPNLCY